jgi:hypothetical protein
MTFQIVAVFVTIFGPRQANKLNLSVISMMGSKFLWKFAGLIFFFLVSVSFAEYLKWVMMK